MKLLYSTFFNINPNTQNPVLVTNPATAVAIAMATGEANLGANGGALFGVRVVTGHVGARLILLDADALLVADDGALDVRIARDATVEMDTAGASTGRRRDRARVPLAIESCGPGHRPLHFVEDGARERGRIHERFVRLMTEKELEAIVTGIAPVIGQFVEQRLAGLEARINAIEAKPHVKFCGTWTAGTTYVPGDAVVRHGGLWICKAPTPGEPKQDFVGWQLAVKQGQAS